MAKRNRQTLKKSFSKGQKPSEIDFENLIDSTLNILDDGFSKSPESGIELAPLVGEKRVVMSVFRESGDAVPEWEITVGTTGDLKICKHSDKIPIPLITLKTDGGIELGKEGQNIFLAGTINAPGRKGTFAKGNVPADGKWHDITAELEGVWALEVVVACGKRYTGKHAILAAMATHCFGNKAKIKKISSHFGGFGNKLKIRWVKCGLKCKLQVKSTFYYGDDIDIHYHISSLWDNSMMDKL